MAKKLHYWAFGLILVWCFVVRVGTLSDQGKVPWFVGCFNSSKQGVNLSFDSSQESRVTPFSCVRLCALNSSFRYAAVQSGSHCLCLAQIQENSRVNQSLCNISCYGDKNITCGGLDVSSVYSLAVPLLLSLNISLPKQMKVNTLVTVVAKLSIKRPRHEVSGLDKIRKVNQTANIVIMEWYSGSKLYNTSWHALQGNWTRTVSSAELMFVHPGNHNICAVATNLFSYLKTCSLTMVGVPITGLKLVTFRQEEGKRTASSLPSTVIVYLKYLIQSGSRPKFDFHFGDDRPSFSVVNSIAGIDSLRCSCVTVTHAFNQCGNLTVSVNASNAVSQLSLVHVVHIRCYIYSVELVKNARDCIYVEANVPKTFSVKVKTLRGCVASYEWFFNDTSTSHTTKVPTYSRVFSGSQRDYYVKVRVFNDFGENETWEKLCVQERLKGVVLKPTLTHIIRNSRDPQALMFTIQLSEESSMYGKVSLKLHRSDRRDPVTGGPAFPSRFNKPGWIVVYAEAANQISKVKSNRIIVHVLDPIVGLAIHPKEKTLLIGKAVQLDAELRSGTNVTFQWDFGNGTFTFNTTSRAVNYTFTEARRFEVKVIAGNALPTSEEASISLVATDVPNCYPPEITIFGTYRTSVKRFQEIRLEGVATVRCSKKQELLYSWKVTYSGGDHKDEVVDLDDDISLTEQVLTIPGRTLHYGKYIIFLAVTVKGTSLKAENERWIKVVQSPLVAIIEGGTKKIVGRKEKKIVMNASASHDPDFPDERDKIRFQWTCSPLQKMEPCFNKVCLSRINMNSSTLTVHLDCLLPNHQEFEFSIKVKKGSRHFSTSQILNVAFKKPHLLSANCLQCGKGSINPSLPLIITGLCFSCQNASVLYTWKLFLVGKAKLLQEEECQASVSESSQNALNHGTGMPTSQIPTSTETDHDTLTVHETKSRRVPTVASVPADTRSFAKFSRGQICQNSSQILGPTLVPTSKRPYGSGSGVGKGSGWGGRVGQGTGQGNRNILKTTQRSQSQGTQLIDTTKEPRTDGSGVGKRSGRGGSVGRGTGQTNRNTPRTTPRSLSQSTQLINTTYPRTDGSGSGVGKGSGRGSAVGQGTGQGNRNAPRTTQQRSQPQSTELISTTKKPTTYGRGDGAGDNKLGAYLYDPEYRSQSERQSSSVVGLSRHKMRLPVDQTTTGFNNQNFVLLGNFLRGGKTFMISLEVSDKSNGRRGTELVFFSTSSVPECSKCIVTPGLGIVLETIFELNCSYWDASDYSPLTYDVRYSVDNGITLEPIYTGFRSVISFVLPAGLAAFNYKVQIFSSVEVTGGAKRRMKPVEVTVKPNVLPKGVTMEEYLLNKTVGRSMLALQETRDGQGARYFITALAKSLNRLESVERVSSNFDQRMQIREQLLQVLQNFSVYDKVSAFQTCLALQTLTKKAKELSAVSVEIASEILQNLAKFMQSRLRMMGAKDVEARHLFSQELVQKITKVTSSLIEASTLLIHSNTGMRKTHRNVLLKATEAAEELIKARLSTLVLGENELQVITHNTRVLAAKTSSVSNALFQLGDVSFHMPTDLEEQLQTASSDKERNCFGTMITIYNENPFFSEMNHTKVGSLSINHCNGEEIQVKNLSSFIHISIPHEKQKLKQHEKSYTLLWKHRNTHIINQTQRMMNQTLHIHFRPISVLPVDFVIKLTVSTAESDSSANSRNHYTFTSSGEPMELHLSPQQLLNASGAVFASVVLEDTAYYRIKSVKGDRGFQYSLRMHWMGCFYWNKHSKDWLSDGCELIEESNDELLSCRCNHLTAFSGAFMHPPNSLRIEDFDVSKLKRPVTLVIVVSITVLYFVLLGVCVWSERHDKMKHGAVYVHDKTIPVAMSQRFQITVQTGHWFGAGTTAGIYVVLHGDGHVSNPIELKCEDRPLFQRSSCDVFVVSVPNSFRDNISKIHVWHDNAGEHPSWFLERIIIKDVGNGTKWNFECNRWLAVDEGDGKVECELLPNTSTYKSSLKECFSQHTAKSFVDYHLWISLLGRPSYSRFTRRQRLTCCWSLLLSFLCVNIAWFRPKTEVPEVLGILDISVESVLVGIMCSIIVLPVNLLWIVLFRYSRRSFKHRVKVYPISEQQTEVTELPSSSVLEQSLETVLFLKNIVERRWFQTSRETNRVPSCKESLRHLGHSNPSLLSSSDKTSLGYNTGHDSLSSDHDPHLPANDGLAETCDFLAALAPTRKKLSVDLDKQSSISVCVSTTASEDKGLYQSRFNLPHIFKNVAWFGCLVTGGVAGGLTIWFGVSLGPDMSIRWLQSLCFSLLESMLISQPIMVLLFILLMARKSQVRKAEKKIDEGFEDLSTSAVHEIHYGHLNEGFEDKPSRSDNGLDPALEIRKRKRYLKFLRPPPESKLIEAKKNCVQRKALWNYTVELFVYTVLFVVTWLLVASVTCPDMYRLNQSIKKTFLRSENPRTGPGSVKDAWQEISNALSENRAASSYTPFTILLRDSQSLLFGRTKITQYKYPLVKVCHNVSISTNQTTNVTNNATVKESTTLCQAKCHAKEGTRMSLELKQTRNESLKQLQDIADSQWISECTRDIAVEFSLYTPFLRAISAATLSVKATYVNKPECHLDLNTFPAFFKSADYGYFLRICKLVFVVILLYLFQREFFLALKMSTKYFTDISRLYQLFTVVLGSLCVVMFIRWSFCLYALLREVETTSQSKVFHYAKLVFRSQEALQALYSLLLLLLFVRCLYMLRPFRFFWCVGKILKSAALSFLACMVVILIFMMAFSHPGHLLFGRLNSAFKSFGETFLLVSSFFRMNGVSRYQDLAFEGHSIMMSLYFAVFLIGFFVVMRGLTAAVFVYEVPHLRKRRKNLLSDVLEDFIRTKFMSLKEMIRKKLRRDSTSDDHANDSGGSDDDEDEDDDEFELEDLKEDSAIPGEHVLDVVDDQIQEMTLRVENLFGSDLFTDCYMCSSEESDDDDDTQYLYRADHSSLFSGSGYESDHSAMSALKWQLSSSSSHDISNDSSRREQQNSSVAVRHPVKGAEMYGLSGNPYLLDVNSDERSDPRFSRWSTDSILEGEDCWRARYPVPGSCDRTNVLREISLCDSDSYDGILRDYNSCGEDFCDRKVSLCSTVSSRSRKSFCVHSQLEKEPVRPKTMYGLVRGCSLKGSEVFPSVSALVSRPSITVEEGSKQLAINSSSDHDSGERPRHTRPRKAKGIFRSSAVHPGQMDSSFGHSPPLSQCTARQVNSGSGDSGVQSAWGPVASVSSIDHERSEQPLKGLLGDISMNRRLGTEIKNDIDHLPQTSTSVNESMQL